MECRRGQFSSATHNQVVELCAPGYLYNRLDVPEYSDLSRRQFSSEIVIGVRRVKPQSTVQFLSLKLFCFTHSGSYRRHLVLKPV